MGDLSREQHLERLRVLSDEQKRRSLTADELREVASHFRALGSEDRAAQAEAEAASLTAATPPRPTPPPAPAPSRPPGTEHPRPPWETDEPVTPRPVVAPRPPAPAARQHYPAEVTSGLATASLVCLFLGLLTCGLTVPLALLLGIVALIQTGTSQGRVGGFGMALAAVIGSVFTIPILAAILFPVFAKAREAAEIATCTVNLKMIGDGVVEYAARHNGMLPRDLSQIVGPRVSAAQLQAVCPASGARYVINPQLAGRNGATAGRPESVALVYESTDGRTLARPHEGAGLVYYADAQVRAIGPDGKPLPSTLPGMAAPPGK